MKKGLRFCSVVICLAAALLLGSTCFAQSLFLAAGSTGAFNATAIGGAIGSTPAICTNTPNSATLSMATNVWIWSQTGKTGHQFFQALDGRGTFDAQNAKGWIEWNGLADGSTATAICVYLGLDSIAGQRMFFATNSAGMPAGSLSFPGGCSTGFPISGDNQVPLFPADTPLPTDICNKINGQAWNAAPTDIRAEDALVGVQRTCAAYSSSGSGFGYTCSGTPSEILSGISGSTGKTQSVTYQITGLDPISGAHVAHTAAGIDGHPYVSINAGGQAVIVLVNTNDTSSNGFGNAALTNINRPDLGRVFTGSATRTRDVIPTAGLASKGFTVLNREPFSGTFNTFEFEVTRTVEFNHTSEDLTNNSGAFIANGPGIAAPSGWVNENGGTAGNPMDWKKTSTGGLKVRVIGTGEMVATIASNSSTDLGGNALTNQIGYAFFSFGNVKPAIGLAKYLTVDGTDPLFESYTTGALPSCTAPCPGAVTLSHIKDGSYPIWNYLRFVTTGVLGAADTSGNCLSGALTCQLVKALQSSYTPIPDLVPIASMEAFRAHYQVASGNGVNFTGHNGFKHYSTGIVGTSCGFAPVSGAAVNYECGGDVNGTRFLIQQELDANTDTGMELTATYKQ